MSFISGKGKVLNRGDKYENSYLAFRRPPVSSGDGGGIGYSCVRIERKESMIAVSEKQTVKCRRKYNRATGRYGTARIKPKDLTP